MKTIVQKKYPECKSTKTEFLGNKNNNIICCSNCGITTVTGALTCGKKYV